MKKSIFGIMLFTLLLLPLLSTTASMVPKPELHIVDIRGGIGLTVCIQNVGAADATQVGYHVIHGDGFFLRIRQWTESLPDIPSGETITMKTRFIRFGIGLGVISKIPWIKLTIYAQDVENTTVEFLARTFGAFVILQNST